MYISMCRKIDHSRTTTRSETCRKQHQQQRGSNGECDQSSLGSGLSCTSRCILATASIDNVRACMQQPLGSTLFTPDASKPRVLFSPTINATLQHPPSENAPQSGGGSSGRQYLRISGARNHCPRPFSLYATQRKHTQPCARPGHLHGCCVPPSSKTAHLW